jgi:hypothetical protein
MENGLEMNGTQVPSYHQQDTFVDGVVCPLFRQAPNSPESKARGSSARVLRGIFTAPVFWYLLAGELLIFAIGIVVFSY